MLIVLQARYTIGRFVAMEPRRRLIPVYEEVLLPRALNTYKVSPHNGVGFAQEQPSGNCSWYNQAFIMSEILQMNIVTQANRDELDFAHQIRDEYYNGHLNGFSTDKIINEQVTEGSELTPRPAPNSGVPWGKIGLGTLFAAGAAALLGAALSGDDSSTERIPTPASEQEPVAEESSESEEDTDKSRYTNK